MGKSIGYQVTIGDASFLVDCGSPLFQHIGGHGLKSVKGLIMTHCHDDHKRWFTDLSLFYMYAPDIAHKLNVLTSEAINSGLMVSSGPALNQSLSPDSKTVIDLDYVDYVNFQPIGPRALYRIVRQETGAGSWALVVVDAQGNIVDHEHAKIIINRKNGAPRLLLRDPDYCEWVEPEQFYPFSSQFFYEQNQNVYHDPTGFTIEAFNAPVWHGVPSIGLKFSTAHESLVFSSDTVNDTELWQVLHTEKRQQCLSDCTRTEFDSSSVIYGDINNFIERIWSKERYQDALVTFKDATVIHDIATRKSVVHTDYRRLKHTELSKEHTILTHSPDKMTSEWPLTTSGKSYFIRGKSANEVVGNKLFPLDAAVYHKQDGRYFVGYKNRNGDTTVYENDGILNLGGEWNWEKGTGLFNVDLYEDINGRYYPKLAEDDVSCYVERKDGEVEQVTYSKEGSVGTVIEDLRGKLVNSG